MDYYYNLFEFVYYNINEEFFSCNKKCLPIKDRFLKKDPIDLYFSNTFLTKVSLYVINPCI